MRFILKSILTLTIVCFTIVSNAQLYQDKVKSESEKFTVLLRLIDLHYADSTDMHKLVETAIVEMLAKLDPHSVYISKDEVEKMNEPLKGSFDGIGISFNILQDTLMVIQTIPGGPSEKVGLAPGDRILYVNDTLIAGVGLTNQMVFEKLRGVRGTLVSLKIKRGNSKELLEFDIIRGEIPIYSLDASFMLDNSTGYIKLNRFSATTSDEFVSALVKLKAKAGFKNLILDLRGNGGGFLKEAYAISDHFLPINRMIVYTEGLKSYKKEYVAESAAEFENGKLIVLIDGGSASASEIVSGAVQDWDRGVIVGRRSFGKGLVQQPYPLTDGSMIRLTTAHYYTPSGRCIQKPYSDGIDEYQDDYMERLESGELFSKDKIEIADSVPYKTLINKRTVYGGGGIIPDVFVPMDTSSNYKYYNQLVRKSVVNQFIVSFVDKNRAELIKKYPQFESYKKSFEISNDMLNELWAEGVKKEIPKDSASIGFITDYAKRHMKAIIARDLWSASEYYEIISSNDEEILEALKVLNTPGRYEAILKGAEK